MKRTISLLLSLLISSSYLFPATILFNVADKNKTPIKDADIIISKIENNRTIYIGEARTDSIGQCEINCPDDIKSFFSIIHPLYEPIKKYMNSNGSNKTIKVTLESRKSFSLLGYNVLKGFSNSDENKATFVNWIKTLSPDVILFQELNDFTEKSLREFAMRYGHQYAYIVKEDGYPCGITSRLPISDFKKYTENLTHGYLHVKCQGIDIYALHLNPHKADVRKEEIAQIIADIKSLPKGAKILVEGDFNAFSLYDEKAYGPQFVTDRVALNPKYKPNYEVTDSMLAIPLYDSFTKFSKRHFTKSFPTNAIKSKNKGCRFDYIFLSKDLYNKCTFANIIQDSVTNIISDHYPNFITINIK